MPAKLKPKVKHLCKVHVWAGISKRGATKILIFMGIMKKECYVQSILKDMLLPFVTETLKTMPIWKQDNDPTHKSKLFFIVPAQYSFLAVDVKFITVLKSLRMIFRRLCF